MTRLARLGVKRFGKTVVNGLFGGLLAMRRALPAGLDEALFHLPRDESSIHELVNRGGSGPGLSDPAPPNEGVRGISCVSRGWEQGCTLEAAFDVKGRRCPTLETTTTPGTCELLVARIPRGRVLGRRCAVIAPRGEVVRELSPFLGAELNPQHPDLRRHAWLPRPRRIKGIVVVAGNSGAGNYYHWICEGLRRLLEVIRYAESEGIALEKAHVAVSAARLPAVAACLEALGFPESRVIRMGRFDQIEADEVIAASVPSAVLGMTTYAAMTLREFRVERHGRPLPRRFVVLRRGYRSFLDDAAVLDALAPFGFEPVRLESLAFADQQALFRDAEAIVAPHGAGLVNLVWTRGECDVLEIMPERYLNACFRAICAARRTDAPLRHAFLVAPEPALKADRDAERLHVDPAALRQWAGNLRGARHQPGSDLHPT
jgi:capsular polysaccharide biosynthesis protein